MTVALFPGSFDPMTNGHLDVINQASKIFDQVYVVIMTNTNKKYLFTSQERLKIAQESLKEFSNVKVLVRDAQLTIDVAKELKTTAIVRGVRNSQDFLYEQQIAGINRELDSSIQTVLLFTRPENSFVASSMIKEVAHFHGNVAQFLPRAAYLALKDKVNLKDES